MTPGGQPAPSGVRVVDAGALGGSVASVRDSVERMVAGVVGRQRIEDVLAALADLTLAASGSAAVIVDLPMLGPGDAGRLVVHRGLTAEELMDYLSSGRITGPGGRGGRVARTVDIAFTETAPGHLVAVDCPPEGAESTLALLSTATGLTLDVVLGRVRSTQRQRWMESVVDVTELLVGPTPAAGVQAVCDHARRVLGADYAWVLSNELDRRTAHHAVSGLTAEQLAQVSTLDFNRTVSAGVINSGQSLTLVEPLPPDGLSGSVDWVGPSVLVPALVGDGVEGMLGLAWAPDRTQEFRGLDDTTASAFSRLAGLAIRVARIQETTRTLSALADRDRIARDLHDRVIQRLYGIGLSLTSTAVRLADPEAHGAVETAIADLDETIIEIRRTITGLSAVRTDQGLVDHLTGVIERSAGPLGFRPEIEVRANGPPALDLSLAGDLLAVLEEALSNVGRHARASACAVAVTIGQDTVSLTVTDDGRGLPTGVIEESGLRNLRDRAIIRGGTMTVTTGPGGCALDWSVPRADELRVPPDRAAPAGPVVGVEHPAPGFGE